jgi:hypothetical protein
VALGGEEVEELLADFGAFHGLALVQPGRFLVGQLARRDALIDALLLVCLTLVDLGRVGLRQNGQCNNGKGSDQQTGCAFHVVLLIIDMGRPHAQSNARNYAALTIEM